MYVSSTDISDYVSGRLDDLDRLRLELALASDLRLRQDIERARRLNDAIKAKFRLTRRTELCCGR